MNARERMEKQPCVCCGALEVRFFRLEDQRIWAACPNCLRGCDTCLEQLNGATELDEAALQEAIDVAKDAIPTCLGCLAQCWWVTCSSCNGSRTNQVGAPCMGCKDVGGISRGFYLDCECSAGPVLTRSAT